MFSYRLENWRHCNDFSFDTLLHSVSPWGVDLSYDNWFCKQIAFSYRWKESTKHTGKATFCNWSWTELKIHKKHVFTVSFLISNYLFITMSIETWTLLIFAVSRASLSARISSRITWLHRDPFAMRLISNLYKEKLVITWADKVHVCMARSRKGCAMCHLQ